MDDCLITLRIGNWALAALLGITPGRCDCCDRPLTPGGLCEKTGIYHGSPCGHCGRRGIHKGECPEAEE